MSPPSNFRAEPTQAVDAFAARVVARLNDGLDEVHPDISERLRFAREQALAKRRAALGQTVPVQALVKETSVVLAGAGRGAGGWGENRAAMWFLSLAFLFVFWMALVEIQHVTSTDAIQEIAEVDTALLLDSLPPSAYSDPGFVQYLKLQSQE